MSINSNKAKELTKTEKVSVVVRVKPLIITDKMQNREKIVDVDELNDTITIYKPNTFQTATKTFVFNHVFNQTCTQKELYRKVAFPIVEQLFKGYNGTIFAYGQTGSGKTYTMTGGQNDSETKGIIPNTFSHIFSIVSRTVGGKSFVISVTYLEIYNEEIRDLLSTTPNQKLELRERTDIGVYVKDLTGYIVESVESIDNIIKMGNLNRATRSTSMNECSSRSHAIFTITLEAKNEVEKQITRAKLNLVDLAGSERVNKTQVTGDGLREAGKINRSLFVLSNVISALTSEKIIYIPYRNSKLTRLLQDSLGGNSKTAMVATISSCAVDYDESLCTLRYASWAKLIKNHVHVNIQTDQGLIEQFEEDIKKLKQQLILIRMKEIEVVDQEHKSKHSKKSRNHDCEFKAINDTKADLNEKLAAVQSKILVAGQNLLDKAQEQQFELETSFELIEKLDQSERELEELLGEKEWKRFELEDEFENLQEQNIILSMKLEELETAIEKTQEKLEDQHAEHQQELQTLAKNCTEIKKDINLSKFMIRTAVPKQQLEKIESNISWNTDTCDFRMNGIQHVGNNFKGRRFRKHIPKSDLSDSVFYERKTNMPQQKYDTVRIETKPDYQSYL